MEDSVYRRFDWSTVPNVFVVGLQDRPGRAYPEWDLEVWGRAHWSWDNMAPLGVIQPKRARWTLALAHGYYQTPGLTRGPYEPSWLITDEEIEATQADYLALGHINVPQQVGPSAVPTYYSGSPDIAKSINLVRLRETGEVEVSRQPIPALEPVAELV
jgi:hypothetical protein